MPPNIMRKQHERQVHAVLPQSVVVAYRRRYCLTGVLQVAGSVKGRNHHRTEHQRQHEELNQ